MSDRVDRARAKAGPVLARLKGALDGGYTVALAAEEAGELLALVKALDEALPSVGPDSDLEVKCSACKGQGCDECEGVGTIATAAGRRVWEFVTRRLKFGE